MRHFSLAAIAVLVMANVCVAEDPVFSGPQAGEKLVPFKVKGVYGDQAGKELDFVKSADGKPVVVVFVHKLTRPSAAVIRVLMNYVASRKKDGLQGGVAWLSEDPTETEALLKRARRALPQKTPIGISVDGAEGPGAYGLNRKVTLTILVAKENKVTGNFALVQPSAQADLPKIFKEIVKVAGGKVPTTAQLEAMMRPAGARKKRGNRTRLDPAVESKVRALIQKTAKSEDVEKVAKELEEVFKKKPVAAREVGRIAQRIINSGKLKNYGTPKAQEYLKKWAQQYGSSNGANPKRKPLKKDKDDKKTDKKESKTST